MGVPYTFATASTTLPLSQLDANFQTPITIGSTNANLGQVVTTISGLTLTNVTISSGNVTVNSVTGNATITGGTINNTTLYSDTLVNVSVSNVATTFPNNFLSNSTTTLGNATLTLGGTTTAVGNLTLNNTLINSVNTTFPNNFLSNSTITLGNATLTLGGTTSTVGNVTLNNPTINGGTSTTTQDLANVTGTLAVTNGGTGLSSLTAGYIPYGNGTSAFGNSANLFWDSTNSRLGVGTSSPAYPLDVTKSSGNNYVNSGRASQAQGQVGYTLSGGTSSTNWLMYMPTSSDNLVFFGNSADRMTLTSTGNVGIGTSSPIDNGAGYITATLNGSTSGVLEIQNNGTSRGQIYSDASNFIFNAKSASTGYKWNLVGSTSMTLDTSGNLGLGVTPSAWSGFGSAEEYGGKGNFVGGNSSALYIGNNAYYNSGWKYVNSAAAGYYYSYAGQHTWYNAPSGTAGNAITFTQAMTLDNSGNLLVGTTTSPSGSSNIVPAATKGINFAANTPLSGATSQLLNWYEEGTWTPAQGGGLTVVGSFSSVGRYVRVGKQVTVTGSVSGSTSIAVGGGGAILTNNLPYTTGSLPAIGNATNSGATASSAFQASVVTLYNVTAIAATTTIYFSVTYNLN